MKRKTGFTLAEVLITLGIIGIIAAMTLPGLIADKKRTELYNQLQAGYSLMSQALVRMNADLGYLPLPEQFKARKFKDEYIKYFDSPIDCGWGGVHATKDSQLCGKGEKVTGDGGAVSELTDIYMTYNKSFKQVSSIPLDDGQFALKNGMLVLIENNGGNIYLSVDVNGVTRKPNVWGHDLFTFQWMNDGKLLPMGAEGTAYTSDALCSKTSTNKMNGIACTQKALTDKTYWNGI